MPRHRSGIQPPHATARGRARRAPQLGIVTPLLLMTIACAPLRGTDIDRQTAGAHVPPARAAHPDIVLITVDSVRPEHVGSYGYARATTPQLDRLAAAGARFEYAYAQAPHTSFSIGALLTGRHFPLLQRLAPQGRLQTLADHLHGHGYDTVAIYPPAVFVTDEGPMAPYRADHFGFRHVHCDYIPADQAVDEAMRFFAAQRQPQTTPGGTVMAPPSPARPVLLWIHLFEPHEPYDGGPTVHFGPTAIDRYDHELAVVDGAIGRLQHYMQQHRPDAIWVVTADHGEAFDEHGESLHGTNLYEEQIRVPLLLRAPHVTPQTVPQTVQLVDVFPTVLRLAGVAWPYETDGRDLMPILQGQPLPQRPAFAALDTQRMVISDGYKLIWDLSHGTTRLFDLRADPRESIDHSARQPTRMTLLRDAVQNFTDEIVRAAERLRARQTQPPLPPPILQARVAQPGAALGLVELMGQSTDPALRGEAARLLLRLPAHPQTRPALLRLLEPSTARNVDAPVVQAARVAALRVGHLASLPAVVQIARDPQGDFELRLQAAQELARRRQRGASVALRDLLGRCTDFRQRRQVITAMGGVRDARVVAALLPHIRDVMVQHEVLRALTQLAAPSAAVAIADRLAADDRVPTRLLAVQALRAIGGATARRALQRAATQDPEPTVRKAARAAASFR